MSPIKPRFAVNTKVPAAQTRVEIETLLKKYGADSFAYGMEPGGCTVGFRFEGRIIRFNVRLPDEKNFASQFRSRWRALLLCIKAKLEGVAAGIETFEEAFMPHVVMPNGKTFSDYAIPSIRKAYDDGTMPPLLTFESTK